MVPLLQFQLQGRRLSSGLGSRKFLSSHSFFIDNFDHRYMSYYKLYKILFLVKSSTSYSVSNLSRTDIFCPKRVFRLTFKTNFTRSGLSHTLTPLYAPPQVVLYSAWPWICQCRKHTWKHCHWQIYTKTYEQFSDVCPIFWPIMTSLLLYNSISIFSCKMLKKSLFY